MSINFTELVTRLDMPTLYLNVAQNDVSLDHGVYPASMAMHPDPQTVYIGYSDEILEVMDKFKGYKGCLNFISRNDAPTLDAKSKKLGFNLFCTKGTTSQIYYLANLILSSDDELSYPNNPLNMFIAEILDGKIETVLEMTTKMKETGFNFENRFVLLLIKPENKLTENLYRAIENLNIGYKTAIYKGSILVFVEAQSIGEHPNISEEKLLLELEKNKALCAVSTTSTVSSLVIVSAA